MSTQNQSVRIEIIGDVQQRDGEYNGRKYTAFSQVAYLHRPSEHYPEKISFPIESANDALKPGFYTIDLDASLQVGQWNSLGFKRNIVVKPEQAQLSKTA